MAEQDRTSSSAIRVAVIGLVGTVLTVCGGLAGALVSAGITIYQVEREKQHIALAAPVSEQALNIDTGSITISRQEAAALAPETYFADLDHGFAIHRPLSGWNELEELTVGEQMAESGGQCFGMCDQPVYRIRYGEPIEIQTDRQVLVNGKPVPEERLAIAEQLYGPPPWTQDYYSQVIINVFEKSATEELGVRGLPNLLLLTAAFSSARFNRLAAEEGSDFMLLQSSATYERVRMAGQMATFTIETWLLLAETEDTYYIVEISFTPQSGQSLQVWEDLQTYIDSFRVVE
jgi:hypothetical protein